MTDTDLITAGESTDSETPSNSVTTDSSPARTHGSDGSLSTMVLPELRALANQAGVKGTSGMRKNELITAIREIRGQAANGVSASSGPEPAASTETPAAQGEQSDSSTEAPRRERRGASRDAGSATREEQDRDGQDAKEGAGPKENTGPNAGPRRTQAADEAESGREGRQGHQVRRARLRRGRRPEWRPARLGQPAGSRWLEPAG